MSYRPEESVGSWRWPCSQLRLGGPQDIQASFKFKQSLLDQFWTLWRKQYLRTLQIQHKWFTQQPDVQPGMLCVVSESLRKRSNWPLYLIDQVYKGRDGRVRNVSLRKGDAIVYNSLPLGRIYPLEVAPYTRDESNPEKPLQPPELDQTATQKVDLPPEQPPDSTNKRLGTPSPGPPQDKIEEDLDQPSHWDLPLDEVQDSMTMWSQHSFYPLSHL